MSSKQTYPKKKKNYDTRQKNKSFISRKKRDPDTYGGNYEGYAGDVWSLGLTLLELYMGHFPFLPSGQRPD